MVEKTGPTRNRMLAFAILLIVAIVLVIAFPRRVKVKNPLPEAIDRARQENKRLYVEFYADWCVPCKIFEEKVLNRPEVKAVLAKFVVVKLDYDVFGQVAREFGVLGIPAGVLLEVEGEKVRIIDRHEGGLPKLQFLLFLAQDVGKR